VVVVVRGELGLLKPQFADRRKERASASGTKTAVLKAALTYFEVKPPPSEGEEDEACACEQQITATLSHARHPLNTPSHTHTCQYEFPEAFSAGGYLQSRVTKTTCLQKQQEMVQVGPYPARIATKINSG
jgi:hypothetical protein